MISLTQLQIFPQSSTSIQPNMSSSDIDLSVLAEEARKYDFVRFTYVDFHGVAKSKAVPRKNVVKKIKEGVPFPSMSFTFGPRTEIILDHERLGPRFNLREISDMFCRPARQEVFSLPWAGGKYKVGEIMCKPYWEDGAPQEACPRSLAVKQVERLNKLGFLIYSAFESEFLVMKQESNKELVPLFPGHDCHVNSVFVGIEEFVYEMMENLEETGVDVEYVHTEYGEGQLELTGIPRYGIDAADMQFRLRNAVKEFCTMKGYKATFMSRPFHQSFNTTKNAMQFNHSLWAKDAHAEGKNVFYDAKGAKSLSQVALYWIAGLCKHAPAITALCCPTVNCYRRMHKLAYPSRADWGYEDRLAAFRARSVDQQATFIESRLPSGSCNPYLTFAATIAAGIDGIVNKLECPPMADKEAATLPKTLAEALETLQNDSVISEALGEEFMDWFIPVKSIHEVEKFKAHDVRFDKAEEIAIEREEYFDVL